MKQSLNFTEQDVVLARKLGSLLSKAKFKVDIQENVELTKCLRFLQELPAKVEGNIFEPIAIHKEEKPEPVKKKTSKKTK